uniref:Uncharacterized protein n=1 Tax=Arundo donax TaxID=35708 RepID=A0A0A9ENJ3_ARUDO
MDLLSRSDICSWQRGICQVWIYNIIIYIVLIYLIS